jgi:GMP synthase-like glutamine amidotransferase
VPNQAFRYGRTAYGLQYHIEIIPEIFELWLKEEACELVEALGPEAISGLSEDWNRQYAAYRQQSTLMIYNFLRMAELA